jgi:hypothetical protein
VVVAEEGEAEEEEAAMEEWKVDEVMVEVLAEVVGMEVLHPHNLEEDFPQMNQKLLLK